MEAFPAVRAGHTLLVAHCAANRSQLRSGSCFTSPSMSFGNVPYYTGHSGYESPPDLLQVGHRSTQRAALYCSFSMNPFRRIQIVGLALVASILLGAGCMRRIELTPTPAARGGGASVRVDLTYDRNNTLQIELSDVPDPSALNPSYTRYVLWVATPDRQTVVNAGQLRVMENRSAEYRLSRRLENSFSSLRPRPAVT